MQGPRGGRAEARHLRRGKRRRTALRHASPAQGRLQRMPRLRGRVVRSPAQERFLGQGGQGPLLRWQVEGASLVVSRVSHAPSEGKVIYQIAISFG
eukprot:8411033-Pyramimonas_sp.AAC.1